MLTGVKGLAKTSGKPGKTQSINHFIVNESWYLVDLPGYGYASVSKRDRKSWVVFIDDYILKRRNLVNLYLLIDSRLEPQKKDLEFIEYLGENAVPFTIVFTKIDKLNKNQLAKNIAFYNKTLKIMWEVMPNTILSSSEKYVGKEELLAEITELLK
jgi:GTP-binding protein